MDDKTRQLIDSTDLLTVLSASGLRTDKVGKMYFSPWNQNESTPSLHLSATSSGRQVWSCFGPVPDSVTAILSRLAGKEKRVTGGGVLDLICAIHGLDSYGKAIKWLEGMNPSAAVAAAERPRLEKTDGESAFIIDRTQAGINARYLVSYLAERAIDQAAADAFCEQLSYRLRKSPKVSYIGIGFRNNGGGYAIRSKLKKWSTGADVTTINAEGTRTVMPSTDGVLVFEGFINFLSWLTIEKKTVPGVDVCVLNSVNNIDRAVPYLLGHTLVRCMLDNDDAGRNCLAVIRQRTSIKPEIDITDEASLYEGFDDINDWLMAQDKK